MLATDFLMLLVVLFPIDDTMSISVSMMTPCVLSCLVFVFLFCNVKLATVTWLSLCLLALSLLFLICCGLGNQITELIKNDRLNLSGRLRTVTEKVKGVAVLAGLLRVASDGQKLFSLLTVDLRQPHCGWRWLFERIEYVFT